MKRKFSSKKLLCGLLAAGICGGSGQAMAMAVPGNVAMIDGLKYIVGGADHTMMQFVDAGIENYGLAAGYALNNDVQNNRLDVANVGFGYSDTTGSYKLYGGYSQQGNADGNLVQVSDNCELYSGVVGGYTELGAAKHNRVNVSGSSVYFGVVGGNSVKGDADNNLVAINNSTSMDPVIGGYSLQGNAKYNTVIIKDSVINGYIYGGYSDSYSDAAGNIVAISGNKNELNDVYGGCSYYGSAKDNIVNLHDLTAENISVYGGRSDKNAAVGNSVNINAVLINTNVYGGYTINGSAENNIINILGGQVQGNIYGGYVDSGNGSISNNVIRISGAADISKADLYGGYNPNNIVFSNNRLIFDGWSGSVNSLSNFDVLEFENISKDNVITINDNGNTYISNAKIQINSVAQSEELAVNDKLKITISGEIIDSPNIIIGKEGILQGVAKAIQGKIDDTNDTITFQITDIHAQRQTAITTESRAGAAAFVNQGAEIVADNLTGLGRSEEGISTFAAVSGNSSKYKTGSYAEVNGWNNIIGVANTRETDSGKIHYGAFFENGSGNYNTFNEFDGTAFRGDGNVVYNGGGVLLRLDRTNGFYTEAALRAGNVKNEADKCLADASGNTYGYKTENAYYGGHIGIGKIFQLDNGKAWDLYGKYFHMHHEGDSVTINNDRFDFDSVDSSKLRIGARFSEQQDEKLTSYYGLAWDYEFSGDVKGTAAGYDMHAPSLEGSTVIGEAGLRYNPGKESPWYFDLNVKGYAGMQKGFSGNVQAVYSF